MNVSRLLVGYVLPAGAWSVLLLRWTWIWHRLSAAQRTQFQWVFAAFALRAANVLTLTLPVYNFSSAAGAPSWLPLVARVTNWIALSSAFAMSAALALLLVREGGAERRQTGLVLGFAVAGYAEAFAGFPSGAGSFFSNFFVQADIVVVRPLLVWCAIRAGERGIRSRDHWVGLAAIAALIIPGVAQGVHAALNGAVPGWSQNPLAVVLGSASAAIAVIAVKSLFDTPTSNTSDTATWLPGQRVLGRYMVKSFLGEGTTGQVFLAKDARTGASVVLKRTRNLSGGQRQVLLAEASALARLRHRHILSLLALEQDGIEPILVLEHAPGGSLASRLAEGSLSHDEAIRITTQVLEGLQAAHVASLIHGDLKPSNILLDRAGRVMVADFGCADESLNPMLPGAERERFRYLAPEQLEGRSADARSDIYAVAVILQDMLAASSRRRSSKAGGLFATASRAGLLDVLRRGLQRAPSRRFQSAEQFARALRTSGRTQSTRKRKADRPAPTTSP